jgi:hypothetical protein
MNSEVEAKTDAITPDQENDTNQENDVKPSFVDKLKSMKKMTMKKRKSFSIVLFILGFIFLVCGIQTSVFYGKYSPQIKDTNDQLFILMLEKTRGESLREIQLQFQSLRNSLKAGQGEIAGRFESVYEIMAEHFREGPLGTIEQVQSEINIIQGMIAEAQEQEPDDLLSEISVGISMLDDEFTNLHDIYSIPYDELHASLREPPFYLWPMGGVLRDKSGYMNAVTFNRSIYMAQIGEIGTSRVLLSGMFTATEDPVLLGLIDYSLGRLQWELFLQRLEPENYFQAVNYVRQSIQDDPDSSLSKRLFDYMLSLTQAESTPGAGKGDPTTLTEGEAGAVQSPDPLF